MSGHGASAQHPKYGAGYLPLLRGVEWEGESAGGGKAIAGLYPQGHSGVPTIPPSLPPPLDLGHHGLGAYGC